MRRTLIGVFAGLLVLIAADTKPRAASYVTSAEIQSTLKGVPADSATDTPIHTVDAGKLNVGVAVVYRSAKASQSAVAHDNVTEVYQILEGTGTLMTGGTIIDAAGAASTNHDAAGPSGPSLRGTGLRGGETRRVGPGDVIVIPPGVPHFFTQIDGVIKYTVVRADPDRVLALK